MAREQLRAMLPEGTEDAAVTKILDALHAEIKPHKDANDKAANDLAEGAGAVRGQRPNVHLHAGNTGAAAQRTRNPRIEARKI